MKNPPEKSEALAGARGHAVRLARPLDEPAGTENPELEEKLAAAGIAVVRACTLVLLRTGQFG